MVDDQAGKCRTEGGTDTHYRAKHALGEIEASGALRHIGDYQCRHHPDHGPRDAVQHLDCYQDKRVRGQSKQHGADW